MRGKWFFLWLLSFACDTDFFPEGLYDYQVERLLSGEGTKSWNQMLSSDNCQDSVKLVFTLISNSVDDSVLVQRLVANEACSEFDTTDLGNADASSFIDGLLFTDTLNFANGNHWIIEDITAGGITIKADDINDYVP